MVDRTLPSRYWSISINVSLPRNVSPSIFRPYAHFLAVSYECNFILVNIIIMGQYPHHGGTHLPVNNYYLGQLKYSRFYCQAWNHLSGISLDVSFFEIQLLQNRYKWDGIIINDCNKLINIVWNVHETRSDMRFSHYHFAKKYPQLDQPV